VPPVPYCERVCGSAVNSLSGSICQWNPNGGGAKRAKPQMGACPLPPSRLSAATDFAKSKMCNFSIVEQSHFCVCTVCVCVCVCVYEHRCSGSGVVRAVAVLYGRHSKPASAHWPSWTRLHRAVSGSACIRPGHTALWLHAASTNNNNNNHDHDHNSTTIFIVISCTAPSYMRDFTLGHLSESRSAPGGCQLRS